MDNIQPWSQLKVSQGSEQTNNIHYVLKKDADSTLKIYTVRYRCHRKPDFFAASSVQKSGFFFIELGP